MGGLFDVPPADASPSEPKARGCPRLQRPNRAQITLRPPEAPIAGVVGSIAGAVLLAAIEVRRRVARPAHLTLS